MKQYMLDTMIFNRILDHDLDIHFFKRKDIQVFTTHVQRDEINKTKNEMRRKELRSVFRELENSVPTESALWDKSNWGESKWSADNLVEKILEELNKKDKRKSNPRDALIADTAIKNNYILVTEDGPLYYVVTEIFEGTAQKLDEFLNSP